MRQRLSVLLTFALIVTLVSDVQGQRQPPRDPGGPNPVPPGAAPPVPRDPNAGIPRDPNAPFDPNANIPRNPNGPRDPNSPRGQFDRDSVNYQNMLDYFQFKRAPGIDAPPLTSQEQAIVQMLQQVDSRLNSIVSQTLKGSAQIDDGALQKPTGPKPADAKVKGLAALNKLKGIRKPSTLVQQESAETPKSDDALGDLPGHQLVQMQKLLNNAAESFDAGDSITQFTIDWGDGSSAGEVGYKDGKLNFGFGLGAAVSDTGSYFDGRFLTARDLKREQPHAAPMEQVSFYYNKIAANYAHTAGGDHWTFPARTAGGGTASSAGDGVPDSIWMDLSYPVPDLGGNASASDRPTEELAFHYGKIGFGIFNDSWYVDTSGLDSAADSDTVRTFNLKDSFPLHFTPSVGRQAPSSDPSGNTIYVSGAGGGMWFHPESSDQVLVGFNPGGLQRNGTSHQTDGKYLITSVTHSAGNVPVRGWDPIKKEAIVGEAKNPAAPGSTQPMSAKFSMFLKDGTPVRSQAGVAGGPDGMTSGPLQTGIAAVRQEQLNNKYSENMKHTVRGHVGNFEGSPHAAAMSRLFHYQLDILSENKSTAASVANPYITLDYLEDISIPSAGSGSPIHPSFHREWVSGSHSTARSGIHAQYDMSTTIEHDDTNASVKVKFPWLHGTGNSDASAGSGSHFPLQRGAEVLIGHAAASPRMPPSALPGAKHISGLKSNSSLGGGSAQQDRHLTGFIWSWGNSLPSSAFSQPIAPGAGQERIHDWNKSQERRTHASGDFFYQAWNHGRSQPTAGLQEFGIWNSAGIGNQTAVESLELAHEGFEPAAGNRFDGKYLITSATHRNGQSLYFPETMLQDIHKPAGDLGNIKVQFPWDRNPGTAATGSGMLGWATFPDWPAATDGAAGFRTADRSEEASGLWISKLNYNKLNANSGESSRAGAAYVNVHTISNPVMVQQRPTATASPSFDFYSFTTSTQSSGLSTVRNEGLNNKYRAQTNDNQGQIRIHAQYDLDSTVKHDGAQPNNTRFWKSRSGHLMSQKLFVGGLAWSTLEPSSFPGASVNAGAQIDEMGRYRVVIPFDHVHQHNNVLQRNESDLGFVKRLAGRNGYSSSAATSSAGEFYNALISEVTFPTFDAPAATPFQPGSFSVKMEGKGTTRPGVANEITHVVQQFGQHGRNPDTRGVSPAALLTSASGHRSTDDTSSTWMRVTQVPLGGSMTAPQVAVPWTTGPPAPFTPAPLPSVNTSRNGNLHLSDLTSVAISPSTQTYSAWPAFKDSHHVGVNESISVGGTQEVTVGGLRSVTVGQSQHNSTSQKTIIGGFKSMSGMDSETEVVELGTGGYPALPRLSRDAERGNDAASEPFGTVDGVHVPDPVGYDKGSQTLNLLSTVMNNETGTDKTPRRLPVPGGPVPIPYPQIAQAHGSAINGDPDRPIITGAVPNAESAQYNFYHAWPSKWSVPAADSSGSNARSSRWVRLAQPYAGAGYGVPIVTGRLYNGESAIIRSGKWSHTDYNFKSPSQHSSSSPFDVLTNHIGGENASGYSPDFRGGVSVGVGDIND